MQRLLGSKSHDAVGSSSLGAVPLSRQGSGTRGTHSDFMSLSFITSDMEMVIFVLLMPVKSDPPCGFCWKQRGLCQGGLRTSKWQEMLVLEKFRSPGSLEKQDQ